MNDDEAPDVLRALAEERVPNEEPRMRDARRTRHTHAIEGAIAKESARRKLRARRFRFGLVIAAAASAVLLVSQMIHRPVPSSPVVPAPIARAFVVDGPSFRAHGGAGELLREGGQDLGEGDVITTAPAGRARVAMSGGAIVELGPASNVAFEGGDHAAVDAGKIAVFVPAVGKNRRTTIVLLGALVAIDDRASVAIEVDPATHAVHVRVEAGAVTLEANGTSTTLRAGDEWPALVPVPAPTSASTTARPTATVDAPAGVTARPLASASAATPASSLAEQNRLLSGALDARRRGDPRKALALADELLARFPTSPLAQAARVERFRALSESGQRAAAAREARAYLADYPQGFARGEAEKLSNE